MIKLIFGTAFVQLSSKFLSVIVGIILARTLSVEGFGTYSFIISLISLASLPVMSGIPQLLIRYVPYYLSKGFFDLHNRIVRWTGNYILLCSLFVVMFIFCTASVIVKDSYLLKLILLSSILIPIKAFLIRNSSLLNAYNQPKSSQFTLLFTIPFFSLLLILICQIFSINIDKEMSLFVYIVSTFLSMLISFYMVSKSKSKESKRWVQSLLPFSLISIAGVINSEAATVVLGILSDDSQVGYFRVAFQSVVVITIGLQAVNTISGPKLSSIRVEENRAEFQSVVTTCVRWSVLFSVPFIVTLLFFGEELIVLLFGVEYKNSYPILLILLVGQFFNINIGSVGLILNTTGHERKALKSQVITLFVTMFFLYLLVPEMGGVGAAISVSSGLIIWNLLMCVSVYRYLGIRSWLR
ncbi:oligosaccharide flippase family protein [Vibrio sp. 10N.286.49.F3]|uniref:oligosaccharide flippase family protein n=1 Tax=Vibrio sp. 10N.286.49.F3 TaxID=3229704 RepID=UPI00354D80E5